MTNQFDTIIIGGGLSGLSAAHTLQHGNSGHRFLLLEKDNRTGGAIESNNDQGFITETGPHGFLDNCVESNQLLEETGLDREIVKAPLIDFVRYVYLNGRLNLIPQTPAKILMAPLIPLGAKLRILADLVKPPLEGEPTVAKWINYRFGPALLPFIDAVFTGTYAGDYDKLTIDSVMPGIRALEKKHGSVLRGLMKSRKKKQKPGGEKVPFQLPAMTSFSTGMQRLPEKLSDQLSPGENLLLKAEVTDIKKGATNWEITCRKGQFSTSSLIIALPVNAALQLLKQLQPKPPLSSIPQTRIATAVFGFDQREQLPPGFGYLTPECENRFALGSLFSSNMFPGRAPENHIVFETLVGGRRHPEKLDLDDQTLSKKALEDVRQILGLQSNPVYSTVLRSRGSIPQLERNYPSLLEWRDKLMQNLSGLHICGFGWEGIGLNDMMKNSTRAAQAILTASAPGANEATVKGVYF
ncbi:MAG: protoporphyrinogen oxidase [Deltaproteobacteria bacterium]|nr:protoporphyrinogen oxidase [Deltaproteobacteria bacterium]